MKKINIGVLSMIFLIAIFMFSFSLAFARSENVGNSYNGRISTASQMSLENASSSDEDEIDSQNDKADSKDENELDSQEHRGAVANFVQALLKTADREKGLGEQVRTVAKQQEQDEVTTTDAIKKIERRSKIKTFLIGSDYKNLGALRSEMVKTRNRILQLTNLSEKIKNASSADEIKSQIKALEQEQTKIESFIKDQEGKFSLFGWLVKIFTK